MELVNFIGYWIRSDYLELFGTITGLFCIYYEVKESYLTWPFGIISSIIYAIFLGKDQLYGQALFQVITVPISIWGWQMWLKRNRINHQIITRIHNLNRSGWLKLLIITILTTSIAYILELKYSSSQYIFADSFSAVLGVIALCMLGTKLIEQWLLWVIADGVPGVIMYKQGYYPSAVLFGCYTALAIIGYLNWKKLQNAEHR